MLNKILLLTGAAAVALAVTGPVLADPPASPPGQTKVTVCHEPPGNPTNLQIITVGSNAAAKGHNVDGAPRGGADHTDPGEGRVECNSEEPE